MTHSKNRGLGERLRRIAEQAAIMAAARETADNILEVAKPLLIGKNYQPFKSGKLAGVYQIVDVGIHPYSGAVIGYGRKITHNGLGQQAWDLGEIHLSRLS